MTKLSKRMWKFYAWCPDCKKVMLFKKTGSDVWLDKAGHEWDWNRDIISEMKKWRKRKERLEKRKKKDHLRSLLGSAKSVKW